MKIAVVIPCYNAEQHLARALDSVLAQDYRPLDIWVVDNNSTDDTHCIIQRYVDKSEGRIKAAHEDRQGAPYARNLGIERSEGQWIQFLDADDELLPHKISQQVQLITAETGTILGTFIDSETNGQQTIMSPWDDPRRGLAHGSHCGQTSANLYARSTLAAVSNWDTSLPHGQDTELLLRLLRYGTGITLDHQANTYYHNDGQSRITAHSQALAQATHAGIKLELAQWLRQTQPHYWQANEQFFLLAIYHHIRMLACTDLPRAEALFAAYLPPKLKLKKNKPLNIPHWNACMVNTFGLGQTERLKRAIRSLLPAKQWAYWKQKWDASSI